MRLRDWLLWIVLAPVILAPFFILFGLAFHDMAGPVWGVWTRVGLFVAALVCIVLVIAALGVLLRRTKEMHASIRRFERMAEETNALLADQGQETAGHRGRSVVAQHPGEARPRAAR